MKTYYKVSFEYSEGIYCTNMAHAETAADVEKHYSEYTWCSVREAAPYELDEAKAKGMPIVEIEHEEPATDEPAQTESKEEVLKMIILEDRNHFKGYTVPESIKRATLAIMKRFSILGECDGMYIANTIGHIDGTGDGKGYFSFYGNKPISKCIEIAERLQHCYSSNIEKAEIEELARILLHGEIDPREAVPGIKKFIQKREEEKKNCDAWRIDYLNKIIAEAQQTLSELETDNKKDVKLNSICEKCLRLGNECAGTYCQVWTGCVYRRTKH